MVCSLVPGWTIKGRSASWISAPGTGVLALIAAQRNATATVDAVEIDDDSAAQAAENVAGSPWADRVRVHRMDVRRMNASGPFDLIICNPPYYAGYSASPDARIGLAKHSDELLFPELIDAVDRLLAADGRFAVIIPLNRETGVPSGGRADRRAARAALRGAIRGASPRETGVVGIGQERQARSGRGTDH